MPKTLHKNITWTSDECLKHTYRRNGEDVIKPVSMMMVDGQTICPRCESEAAEQQLQDQLQKQYDEEMALRKHNTLYRKSIISDRTILDASFDSFQAVTDEEKRNKSLCLDIAKRLNEGQAFNVFLQGNQGAGKSHLAYSLLLGLNEMDHNASSLFVSVEEMMRRIKDSFNNKESKYTEQYFVELLSSVDYLVLDDLGAETGAIDTDKQATNFVQRILYAVTNARQGKVTISTTNLSSESLFSIYDKKLVSRLLSKPVYVVFKETKDKRMANLPF